MHLNSLKYVLNLNSYLWKVISRVPRFVGVMDAVNCEALMPFSKKFCALSYVSLKDTHTQKKSAIQDGVATSPLLTNTFSTACPIQLLWNIYGLASRLFLNKLHQQNIQMGNVLQLDGNRREQKRKVVLRCTC